MAADILTVREVAKYLHVHESTIYRMLKRAQLPAFRVGSDWRFNLETIDRWRLSGGALPTPHK
jgi:excisionase family DNA binding protein